MNYDIGLINICNKLYINFCVSTTLSSTIFSEKNNELTLFGKTLTDVQSKLSKYTTSNVKEQLTPDEQLTKILSDSEASEIVNNLNSIKEKTNETYTSFDSYFTELNKKGQGYIANYVKENQNQIYVTEDVIEASKKAQQNQIAHNEVVQQSTLAFKASKIAMQGLAMAGNMIAMWAITEVVGWAVNKFDELHVTVEESRESLESFKQEASTIQSELQSVNEELTTTRERMDELEAKGVLSLTEKEEYENLQITNDELERRLKLLELEKDINSKEKNSAFIETMEKDASDDNEYWEEQETGKIYKGNSFWSMLGGVRATDATESDYVEQQLNTYEQNLKKLNELDATYQNDTNNKDYKSQRKQFEEQNEQIADYLIEKNKQWTSDSEGISYIKNPTSEDDENVNKWLNYIQDFQKRLLEVMSDGEPVETTPLQQATDSLDKLVSVSGGLNTIGNAFKELSDNGYMTMNAIASIKEIVGDSIPNWDTYQQKLMNVQKGSDEFNQIMGELTYAALEAELGVKGLATADEQYVTTVLRENGVLNANAVAKSMIADANSKMAVQSKIATEIIDGNSKLNLDNMQTEAEACGLNKSAYASLMIQEIAFNNNTLDASQKITQINAITKSLLGASSASAMLQGDLESVANASGKDKEKYATQNGITVIKDTGNYTKSGKKDWQYEVNGVRYETISEAAVAKATSDAQNLIGTSSIIEPVKIADTKSETQSFKESFNWIETALSRAQRAITNFGKTVAATWQSWKVRNAALKEQISAIKNEISLQDQAYSKYMSLADSVGLSEGYKKLVREGAINIETIESESIAEAIKLYQEYYEKALVAKDASADLKDELAALAQTKFSNLAQSFADLMSGNEHSISMYEATIELMEKRGYTASASLYDSLKEAELKNQDILKEKYQSLSQALDEAVSSGTVVKYSEQWYQMQNEILAVEEAIIQSNIALAEYDNSLRDLEWSAFDKLHEEISEIYEETEFLDKLLSDEKKFNEDGSLTEAGQAALGLHTVNYKTHLAQAEEYAQELERIKEELAKDPYNQDLLDRQNELEEKHREVLTNIEEDEQSMIDTVSESYDTLLDHMDQMIDKRKNMLTQVKDLYEYEKNISKQTQEIASLEKQLAAYQGDDSEEARATIQKLQVSLSEAKENLEETEYEKYISDQEEMLDTLRLQTEEWINARLDNEDQLLKDIVGSTEKNAAMINDTLTEVASSTGITLSEAMKTIWSNDGDIGKAMTEIKNYLAGMQKNNDEKAKEQVKNNTPASSNSGTTTATSSATTSSTPAATSTSKWGDFFIKKSDSYPKNKLNRETSIVDRLKYSNFDSSFSARSQYYTAMGGSGVYTGSSSQNRWMINQMKANGYARGGFIGDMIRAAGEDGIALVRRGEGIIPTNMVPEWNALIHHLPQLNNSMLGSIGQHSQKEIMSIGDINVSFELPNVQNYSEFMTQMQNDSNFERMIQDMTLGVALGGHSMKKYQYKW